MTPDTDNAGYIELGRIVGVWGLKGWTKVHSHTGQRADILDYKTWYLGDEHKRYRLLAGHLQGRRVVASLDGVTTPEIAQQCVGKSVSIATADLPALEDGDFYWMQIEGLEAVDTAGASIGIVDHLFETGANDVLVIRKQEKETLVPYVPDVVRKVDLENGIIELNWEMDA